MSLLTTVKQVFGNIFTISQGYSQKHDGLDLAAPIGTPIHAVTAGIVEYARDARVDPNCLNAWSCGGGNVVNINIGGDKAVQYAHLSRIAVSSGSRVAKGQVIGYVGDTGGKNADGSFGGAGSRFVGSHLHLGLWDKAANRMINPQPLLEGKPMGGVSTPTTPGDVEANLSALQEKLKAIGIDSSPTHKFTKPEALLIANLIYKVQGDIANSIALDWEGTTVQEQATRAANGETRNVNAITDVQNSLPDISGALMFIGVILIGLTFLILGGIVVLRKPNDSN